MFMQIGVFDGMAVEINTRQVESIRRELFKTFQIRMVSGETFTVDADTIERLKRLTELDNK